MDRLLSAQRGLAASQAASRGQPRMAIVTSYNPNDGTAKVTIQPEGTQTGWLPVLSQSVGSGWGIHVPLKTGEQVMVLTHEGSADDGVVVGRCFSDKMQPPGVTGSDIFLKSSTGAIINLLTNGHISISDDSGSNITFGNNGSITVTCQNFAVNASTGVTIQTPDVAISQQVHIGTGPLRVNNVIVVVP